MRARLLVSDPEDAAAAARLLAAAGWETQARPQHGPVDLIVVDEWTPETAPHVVAARASGTPVTVLAELVLQRAAGPVVAVSGTAGKTSTCRALAHIITACGGTVAISGTARSGNAWPDRSLVVAPPADAVTIAELTSTHLCHMGEVRADVAVLTRIRPDHSELHGGLERYYAAKRRLVDAAPPGAAYVLPVDDPVTMRLLGRPLVPGWAFGRVDRARMDGAFVVRDSVVLRAGGTEVAGPPGATGTALRAALAAACSAMALGVPPDAVAAALGGIPVVPHRMARHGVSRGITLIDDTMAATPLKALAAIRAVPDGPLVLIVGGDDAPGGTPVHTAPEESAALARALDLARSRADRLIAFGPAAQRVAAHVRVDDRTDDVTEALAVALARCPRGGTVLASPMFPVGPADREWVAASGG